MFIDLITFCVLTANEETVLNTPLIIIFSIITAIVAGFGTYSAIKSKRFGANPKLKAIVDSILAETDADEILLELINQKLENHYDTFDDLMEDIIDDGKKRIIDIVRKYTKIPEGVMSDQLMETVATIVVNSILITTFGSDMNGLKEKFDAIIIDAILSDEDKSLKEQVAAISEDETPVSGPITSDTDHGAITMNEELSEKLDVAFEKALDHVVESFGTKSNIEESVDELSDAIENIPPEDMDVAIEEATEKAESEGNCVDTVPDNNTEE